MSRKRNLEVKFLLPVLVIEVLLWMLVSPLELLLLESIWLKVHRFMVYQARYLYCYVYRHLSVSPRDILVVHLLFLSSVQRNLVLPQISSGQWLKTNCSKWHPMWLANRKTVISLTSSRIVFNCSQNFFRFWCGIEYSQYSTNMRRGWEPNLSLLLPKQ